MASIGLFICPSNTHLTHMLSSAIGACMELNAARGSVLTLSYHLSVWYLIDS